MHQQNRTCHYAVVQIHQTKTYYDRTRALFQMCQAYHINLRHRLRNHTCAWFAWLLAEADVDLLWLLVGCVRPGGEKQAGQQASQTGCWKTWKTGDWVTPIRVGNILQMSWTTLSKNALLTQAPGCRSIRLQTRFRRVSRKLHRSACFLQMHYIH